MRVAPGEDPLSAAQRFGRENSLRPHEVDKVRHGIQKQLGRIDRRLRVEPPPPKSTDAANKRSEVAAPAQKPTSTVAQEAPKAQAAKSERIPGIAWKREGARDGRSPQPRGN